ncbi:TPA: hypothetical protein ORN00_004847 [Klebsiella aerogenes]|nr:hypothetical protein [Klebsiella aerogenes]HCM7801571.1 hypothetical protein [Klebsiella aerogenes]HCS4252640.1 hypothetical protein [Klebsiella aerogenes]
MAMPLKILCFIAGLASLIFFASMAKEADRRDCEERIAKELNTTAVYINNHCMVKGYGRADGR